MVREVESLEPELDRVLFRAFAVGVWATVLVLLCSGVAAAQAVKGGLVGNIVDSSGLALPGVNVTITEVNDPPTAVNDTIANINEDSGNYSIPFATLTGNDSKGPSNESTQTLTVANASSPTMIAA